MSDGKPDWIPVEVEGREYRVWVRAVLDEGSHGHQEYSLDGGETWHARSILGYLAAKRANKLVPVKPAPGDGPDELVALTSELLAHVRLLKPGESLKITRAEAAVVVTKEAGVLAFRYSALEDGGVDVPQEKDDA